MRLAFAILADEANSSSDGKLNVLGAFDRLVAGKFPVTHPKMVLAVRLHADFIDSNGESRVRVRLVDEDGASLIDLSGQVRSPAIEPGQFFTIQQMFQITGLAFPRPGMYKFEVSIEDECVSEIPLRVDAATPEGHRG